MTGRLSDRAVRAAKPGKHPDGHGLYLRVTTSKGGVLSRYWLFRYAHRGTGKDRQLGLGPYPTVGLADARRRAADARRLREQGLDPIDHRGAQRAEAPQLSAAEKFLSFIERGIKPTCYLYRHYHPNGDLLYVGISLRALGRQQKHTAEAEWWDQIHRIVIEPFETREGALAAEEAAIRLEFPKFNTVHNDHRNLHREIARMRTEVAPPSKEVPAPSVTAGEPR